MRSLFLILALGTVPAAFALEPLADDEGYLFFSTDLSTSIAGIELRKEGQIFRVDLLEEIDVGLAYHLIALPEGRYYFDTAVVSEWAGQSIKVELGEELTGFSVAPGKVNYMGHVIFSRLGFSRFFRSRTNRYTQALQWLLEEHPEIAESLTSDYTGPFPDPFPAYIAELKEAQP